jgi:hydroxylamine reductase (hybrid-cluster protein)
MFMFIPTESYSQHMATRASENIHILKDILEVYKLIIIYFTKGSWRKQSIEFPFFPGAIVMTTNCLTVPHPEYSDRLFTAGAVGFPGIPHISDTSNINIFLSYYLIAMDFSPAIAKAKEMKGWTEKAINELPPTKNLVVGYGHEAVLASSDAIIKSIQSGDISRFYVIGGCDGFEGERNYYTELAKMLPKTSVVLTAGCGKYRINQLSKI